VGDVADMMLDGTLCAGCGVYLEGETFDVETLSRRVAEGFWITLRNGKAKRSHLRRAA